jgi:hypothetical protein
MRYTGKDRSRVIESWRKRYLSHSAEVRNYFGNRDVFLDLELKKGNELLQGNFLKKHGFPIVVEKLPQMHKTENRLRAIEKRKKADEHVNAIRDAALFLKKRM